MRVEEIKIPEFAFIHGSEHDEDNSVLEGRTLFIHFLSLTVFELYDSQDVFIFNKDVPTYNFQYMNIYGAVEELVLAAYFSMAESDKIEQIFERAANWYRDYCNFEDRRIDD